MTKSGGAEENARERFEAAALPFTQALHNKALYLIRRPEGARDLVQETFLRAYRTFGNFKEGTNCKAWLFTILYSIFINKYRKRQREPDIVSLDQMDRMFHRTLADGNRERDSAALTDPAQDWQGPEVRQALGNLPENFRAAVLLVECGGSQLRRGRRRDDLPGGYAAIPALSRSTNSLCRITHLCPKDRLPPPGRVGPALLSPKCLGRRRPQCGEGPGPTPEAPDAVPSAILPN